MILAGTPATTQLSETTFVTTAPAPTTTISPTRTRVRIASFVPILEKEPILTCPVTRAPCDNSTKSPTTLSCDTDTCGLSRHPFPMVTPLVTTTPLNIQVPSPMVVPNVPTSAPVLMTEVNFP